MTLDERILPHGKGSLDSIPNLLCVEKTHIVAPVRFSSRMKAKGKTYVRFPIRHLNRHKMPLQAASPTPHLAVVIWG